MVDAKLQNATLATLLILSGAHNILCIRQTLTEPILPIAG
jgi:hypothetical protein